MSKKPKRNHLKKLIKAWAQATTEDREAFLDFVAAETRANGIAHPLVAVHDAAPVPAPNLPQPLIANGRYLLPATIERIEKVMRARRLTPRAVMAEMGFPADDHALARALAMKASLRLSVIAALGPWLYSNRAHIR
ncbi:hypothetical protein [Rhizobium sp. 18065]|uniref:hypothetical protein n=1 Tax=Rhizobium sp. 18065 TaxID=2681411 RepID=UPI00135C5B9B|nr:hypothetical protein [Rhizobium sp. 18065]